MDREDSGTFVVGAAILAIGAALLVDRIGILPWTARWSVWPLLLIAYGVIHLAQSPWSGPKGIFPIALGLWIWASEAGWIAWRDSWPLMFVVLGVAVMWQAWGAPDQAPLVPHRRPKSPLIGFAVVAMILAATTIDARHYAGPIRYVGPAGSNRGFISASDTADQVHVSVLMGEAHRVVSSQTPFHGGDVNTMMGDTEIDLRNAVSDGQPMTLDISVLMGDVTIRVPQSWTVDNQITPFLGQVDDRRGQPEPIRVRRASRRGGNGDTWTDQGSNGSTGSIGSIGSNSAAGSNGATGTNAADSNGATGGSNGSGASGTLVLTGSVTMGDLTIR